MGPGFTENSAQSGGVGSGVWVKTRFDLSPFPGMRAHLVGCPACHEDFLSLFALVARDEPRDVRDRS